MPWTIASIYNQVKHGSNYAVKTGPLAFSVTIFLFTSVIALIILVARRCTLGGELGGPALSKYASAILLALCWVFYVVMSSLQTMEVIDGF